MKLELRKNCAYKEKIKEVEKKTFYIIPNCVSSFLTLL